MLLFTMYYQQGWEDLPSGICASVITMRNAAVWRRGSTKRDISRCGSNHRCSPYHQPLISEKVWTYQNSEGSPRASQSEIAGCPLMNRKRGTRCTMITNAPHCNRQFRVSIACPKFPPRFITTTSSNFTSISKISSVRMRSRKIECLVSGLKRASTLGPSRCLFAARISRRQFLASSNTPGESSVARLFGCAWGS